MTPIIHVEHLLAFPTEKDIYYIAEHFFQFSLVLKEVLTNRKGCFSFGKANKCQSQMISIS